MYDFFNIDPVIYKNKPLKKENVSTVYSDRLYQWDHTKYNKYHKEVFGNEGQIFYDNTPEDIEKFLALYFEKNIRLLKIEQHTNKSNGFPYWRFDFETL